MGLESQQYICENLIFVKIKVVSQAGSPGHPRVRLGIQSQ